MAKVQVTRVLTSTSTGNQDVTISGFGTVKGAIVVVGDGESNGVEQAHALMSIGFADGTNNACDAGLSRDANSSSDTKRYSYSGNLIAIIDPNLNAGVLGEALSHSFITDGIRIVWDSVDSTQRYMTVILIGGSDVSCKAGGFLFSASVGNTDSVTGLGIDPTAVFFTTQGASTDDYFSAHSGNSFGVAVDEGSSVISQFCFGTGSKDNAPTIDCAGAITNDSCVRQNYPLTNSDWEGELTSFDTGGFTLTARDHNAADWVHYLAIDFGAASLKTGTVTAPTATGDFAITGMGFKPQFALMGLGLFDAYGYAAGTDVSVMALSMFDDTNEYCEHYRDEDAAATSNTGSLNIDKACKVLNYDGASTLYEGVFKSFDSGGLTLDITTEADSTTRYWGYFAVEEESAGTEVLPGTGAVAYTGYAPTVATTDHKEVLPGTGVATYMGYAPTVTATDRQEALPGLGEVTYTGYAPTITASDHIEVLPDTGVITYVGFAPTVSISDNINVSADVGAVTYTGFEPTIQTPVNVNSDLGEITYTGFTPTVNTAQNKIVEPGTGAITYTGFSPTISVTDNKNVQPGTGSATYAGLAPTISTTENVEVQPGTGAITYTGFEPVVTYDQNVEVSPNTGVITYSGFAPTVTATASAEVLPETGQTVYEGFAPVVFASDTIEVLPSTGEVTFAGYVPTISISDNTQVQSSTGEIVYTGYAPTIDLEANVLPGYGEVIYTGFAPGVYIIPVEQIEVIRINGYITQAIQRTGGITQIVRAEGKIDLSVRANGKI